MKPKFGQTGKIKTEMVMAAGGAGPDTEENPNHIPPNTPDRPEKKGPIGGGPQSPEIIR